MKKKITNSIFCVTILFFSFNVYSQTLRERQEISKSYINSGNSDEITSVIQDYMGKQRRKKRKKKEKKEEKQKKKERNKNNKKEKK